MLVYKKVAVIDHDWSLYRLHGFIGYARFIGNYAIVHDEDAISDEFWEDLERVSACVISKTLGQRLEAYYE